ncbi:MAG: MBL fold metallo-hydrolase [Verrucomicrobiaceae bacterium]|nr:MAG: MBL fold metallo-hydrolase [Verrucomicrobiaceae bacterium]
MSNPPVRKQPVRDLMTHLRQKSHLLSLGGRSSSNEHQVGLLPNKGSLRRNYHFVKRVLLPQIFSKRGGQTQRPDLAAPESHEFRVTWIGHASYLVQTEGVNVLIDPVWAKWLGFVKRVREPGLHIEELPPIHLVLISHAHFDHLHLGSLARVAGGQPIITPRGVGPLVARRGFGEVVELDYWEKVMCGPLEITFTPSKHWGARMVHDVHRGFGGFLIRNSAGRTVFHCGDSAYFDGFQRIGDAADIDLAMMPIGAYESMSGREVHMNPEEAVAAFNDMKAKHMIPMHYGTFPLGGELMHEPLERLARITKSSGLIGRITVPGEGDPTLF